MHTSVCSISRIKIGGEAGDGIISAGDIVMKIAVLAGYYASMSRSFPSNIKSGYTQSLITVSTEPVVSPVHECDILFSISAESFLRDTTPEQCPPLVFIEASLLTTDACRIRSELLGCSGIAVFGIPFHDAARKTGSSVAAAGSTMVVGVACKLLGLCRDHAHAVLTERFGSKSSDTARLNIDIFDNGYAWAAEKSRDLPAATILDSCTSPAGGRLVVDGNQAVALGALHAGCTFYASYPITPATSLGETLARFMHQMGGFVYQAEDEMAALGAVEGASFSGVKAMTGTSGPGLSLMQEFIGYASMAELPVVIVDVQRVGPSTGMPTKHSQDDLFAAIYGGHGEGQRIVLAPLDVEDCFHATVTAFNCAERYQCPVLLLSDSTLATAKNTITKTRLLSAEAVNRTAPAAKTGSIERGFRRYALDTSYVNPLPSPGNGVYTYRATGIEHDESGGPAATPVMRSRQMERRFGKLGTVEETLNTPAILDIDDGPELCDVAVCAWGFTASATMSAVAMLREMGIRIAAIYPRLLFPVCRQHLLSWSKRSSCHVVIEANFTGQYGTLIKSVLSIEALSITAYRGEPFTPGEIVKKIRELCQKKNRSS